MKIIDFRKGQKDYYFYALYICVPIVFLIILGICYWWFKCCTHPINVNDKVLQKEKEITIDNVNCRVKKLEVVVEK